MRALTLYDWLLVILIHYAISAPFYTLAMAFKLYLLW